MATVVKPSQNDQDRANSSGLFLTLYFPAFVFALGSSIATPAIPVFAKSFETSFGVASLVIVMHALGGLVAAVPSGFLVDRFGRRVILIAGPLLMALSSGLTALASSFSQLLAYRFIGGVAMEMWRQARLAIIADVGKQRQRGRQITGMVGTESSGRLIGPAIGGALATWSIQVPFVAGFLWIHGSHAITSGSMQVLGTDMAPTQARGRFFGFWRMVGEVGSLVSPALFGFVAENAGYGTAFTITGLFALMTAGLLGFSVKETVGRGQA